MELHNFDELRALAHSGSTKPRMAVAAAEDGVVIDAALAGQRAGYAQPIFIGAAQEIRRLLSERGESPTDYRIIDTDGRRASGVEAVRIVRQGEAECIMKGLLETRDLLGPVVDRDSGIGTGRVMSHVALNAIPGYHKLFACTDAAMIIAPTLEQKRAILDNAIRTLRAVGYEAPRFAVLAAVEAVNPKMPETLDAAALKQLAQEGAFGPCVVEGPISYDLMMSCQIARHKGFSCPWCGDFDGVLVPNIVTGNALGKCWSVTAGGSMAGLVVGAQVPIILTSRGAALEEKVNSIAFAAAMRV